MLPCFSPTATHVVGSSFKCNMLCQIKKVSDSWVEIHGRNQDIRKIYFDGSCTRFTFFFVCLQKCTQNMNQTPVDGRRIAHRFVWIWVNYNKLTATSLECLGIFQGIFSMFHDECHICEWEFAQIDIAISLTPQQVTWLVIVATVCSVWDVQRCNLLSTSNMFEAYFK